MFTHGAWNDRQAQADSYMCLDTRDELPILINAYDAMPNRGRMELIRVERLSGEVGLRQRMQPHGDDYPVSARQSTGSTTPRTYVVDTQPLIVRYAEQREHHYLVHELDSGDTVSVPKRRATEDVYPARNGHRPPGSLLLRWSKYALFGVVCAGALGIVLGVVVVCVGIVRLAGFRVRARRWLRRNSTDPLPAIAATERMYLLAALGQGMLAILLGSMVLALLLERLR